MDTMSLSDREHAINPSVIKSTLDELSESLAKIAALANVTLCHEFWSFEHKVQYNYMCVLSDLVDQAQQLCDQPQSTSLE